MIGLHCQRALETGQCLIEPVQVLQGDTTIEQRLRIVWLQGKRAVVARQRLFEQFQLRRVLPRL